jgi:hypothetical protein
MKAQNGGALVDILVSTNDKTKIENIFSDLVKLKTTLKDSATSIHKTVKASLERFVAILDDAIVELSDGNFKYVKRWRVNKLEELAKFAKSVADDIKKDDGAMKIESTKAAAQNAIGIATSLKQVTQSIIDQSDQATKTWYDSITGYLWPTESFSQLQDVVESYMPSVPLPELPESLSPAENELSKAIQQFIDRNPMVTRNIPWVLFGVALVCLGLRAAWPKIRASYIAAEKIAKKHTAHFVESFNSEDDDEDEDDIPQPRRPNSNRNRKSSHRYGKSKKAYSSTR